MVKPVFFVDGYMERNILQELGINAPIRRTNLNGKNVTISAIADKISDLLTALSGRNNPIIILIDREGRRISASRIIEELSQKLLNKGVKGDLIIGVADRMIENWILADWDNFIKKTDQPSSISIPDLFEGKNGKSKLKKYLPHYQETTDGPKLFSNSRASIIKLNSKSFKKFITQIINLECNCHWLTR